MTLQRNGKRVLLGLDQREHLFLGWSIHIPLGKPSRLNMRRFTVAILNRQRKVVSVKDVPGMRDQ